MMLWLLYTLPFLFFQIQHTIIATRLVIILWSSFCCARQTTLHHHHPSHHSLLWRIDLKPTASRQPCTREQVKEIWKSSSTSSRQRGKSGEHITCWFINQKRVGMHPWHTLRNMWGDSGRALAPTSQSNSCGSTPNMWPFFHHETLISFPNWVLLILVVFPNQHILSKRLKQRNRENHLSHL
jgi:hypothetical protein